MKTTKKLLALLLGAVMLLGMLAGCGENASQPSQTKAPGPQVPVLSGMLVLSARASFKIAYDQEGMVMEVSGTNEEGVAIAEEFDPVGKSCSTAVKELIAASAEATLLREATSIVLKLAVGSQLPSETFLDAVAKDAADAAAANASSAPVVTIGLDGLDADGYINPAFAQTLLKNELGVSEFESYNGGDSLWSDYYTVYIKAGDLEGTYLIDAVTGLISEFADDEITEPGYIEEEAFDPSFEEVEEPMGEDVEGTIPEEEPTV